MTRDSGTIVVSSLQARAAQRSDFSLKWNKAGDSLISVSVDKTPVVWGLEIWRGEANVRVTRSAVFGRRLEGDTNVFATSSMDKKIYVCEVGKKAPLKKFEGHLDDQLHQWDPTSNLLASCSDDYTAKIWSANQNQALFTLANIKGSLHHQMVADRTRDEESGYSFDVGGNRRTTLR